VNFHIWLQAAEMSHFLSFCLTLAYPAPPLCRDVIRGPWASTSHETTTPNDDPKSLTRNLAKYKVQKLRGNQQFFRFDELLFQWRTQNDDEISRRTRLALARRSARVFELGVGLLGSPHVPVAGRMPGTGSLDT
jgi:hypothetical protein